MERRSRAERGISNRVLATVLGGLLAIGASPAVGHDAKDQEEFRVYLIGRNPSLRALDEPSFDATVRALLCVEAREAVNENRLHREAQEWILINAHRCQDDRLLLDAFVF